MAVIIPLNSTPSYTFSSNVDGFTLGFRLRWNDREQTWRLDIQETSGIPIVQGLKLLPNQNLTKSYNDPRLPSGNFYILEISGNNPSKPTFESIGDIQRLYYLTKEEEDELRSQI